MEIKRTERGWSGHFCASMHCNFRRNTLLEAGKKKIVVSTVGNMRIRERDKIEAVGYNRYYETMAFEASLKDGYWDADVSKQIDFKSKWYIDKISDMADNEANDMHEMVVSEISGYL